MEPFLIAGSAAALGATLCFLSIGTSIMLKVGKPRAIHAYVFFAMSILMLVLYAFLWQLAMGRVSLGSTGTNGVEAVNVSPLWLSAIGTTLLAMMTFVISILIPWWRKPRFTIKFDNVAPYCMKGDEPPQSYWLRLKVTNSGKSVAKRCIGKIVKFIDTDDKGKLVERTDLDPVMLHWVGTTWGYPPFFGTIDLNREEPALLDVLVTKADSPGKAFVFTYGFLQGTPKDILNGTGQIQITIYDDDVKPCSKEYSISWDDSNYTSIRLKEK